MQKRTKKLRFIIILFKGFGIIFILTLLGCVIYGWLLSRDIEKRFSGRRWSIPSKVYSDSTILYPGQRINPELFFNKLKSLGYREIRHKPKQKGELRRKGEILELFLNDLRLPLQKREGFPVKISISKGAIMEITHSQSGEPIPLL